jgi:hypothetical protein
MKRLSIAIDVGRNLAQLEEPEKSLAQARFYELMGREHFPSRSGPRLFFVLVWYVTISLLFITGRILQLSAPGWFVILGLMALTTLVGRGIFRQHFSPDSTPVLMHEELRQKQEDANERFLNLTGHSSSSSVDLEGRIRQRERYDRWIKPIVTRSKETLEQFPWLRPASAFSVYAVLLYAVAGIMGLLPWF